MAEPPPAHGAGPDIAATLRKLGIDEEIIERAVERGDPIAAVFEQVLSSEKVRRTVSATEIEERGGIGIDQVNELVSAFGLRVPEPDEAAFTESEAEALVRLGAMSEIYPPAIAIQVGRVYGRLLARIAQAEVQVFRTFVEPRLEAELGDAYTTARAIRAAFAEMMPIADPLLIGVHRRWVEHQVMQAAVGDAEAGTGLPLPGSVEVTFLFCDLKGFTRYVDQNGDAAGVAAIDHLADVVVRQRGQRFRFTKFLGDGVMLAYGDSVDAVEAGARIIAAMSEQDDLPQVHASVHHGVAIAREGDYFGHAVNLAARIVVVAEAAELLATRAVLDRCPDRFEWERAGAIRIRGIAGLVELFRLTP